MTEVEFYRQVMKEYKHTIAAELVLNNDITAVLSELYTLKNDMSTTTAGIIINIRLIVYIRIGVTKFNQFITSLVQNKILNSDFFAVFLFFEEILLKDKNILTQLSGSYITTSYVTGITNYYSSVFQTLYTAETGVNTKISSYSETAYGSVKLLKEAYVEANSYIENITTEYVRLLLPKVSTLIPSGISHVTNENAMGININLLVLTSIGQYSLIYPHIGSYNYIEPNIFMGNTPKSCINGPIEAYYKYSNGLLVTSYILFSLISILLIFYSLFLLKNRRKRIIYIYGNNANFFYIFGLLMVMISCLMFSLYPDQDGVCNSRIILFGISFMILNCGLMAKSIKMHFNTSKIVNNQINYSSHYLFIIHY